MTQLPSKGVIDLLFTVSTKLIAISSLRQALNTPETESTSFANGTTMNVAAHCGAALPCIVRVRRVKSTLAWCAEAHVRLAPPVLGLCVVSATRGGADSTCLVQPVAV